MQIPETAMMPMAPVPPSHLHRKGSSFQGGTATTGACSGNCRSPLQKPGSKSGRPGSSLSVRGRCATSSIYPRDSYLQFLGSLITFPAQPADECFKHQSSPCSGSFIFLVDGGVLGYQLPQWAWFVRAIQEN